MISTLQTLLLFLRRWHMWVAIENHRRWDGGFFLCCEPCHVQKSLTALLFVGFATKKHSWTMIHLTMQARWASECYFKDHANYFVVDMCKKRKQMNETIQWTKTKVNWKCMNCLFLLHHLLVQWLQIEPFKTCTLSSPHGWLRHWL